MKKKTEEIKKIKIIIDSDVANEIDDQFAISYALSRPEELQVLAITLAPYRVTWQKNLTIRDGMVDSKNEADRILRLFGIKYNAKDPLVYFGCDGFLSEGFNGTSPAVEKIIKTAKKEDCVYVVCIGTLTNVAMALRQAPKIASKIKIVWMGTDNIMLDHFKDSNYCKDVAAFDEVISHDVDFTVFPSYLARNFVTSVYEFERNIEKNNVTSYLASIMTRFRFNEENWGIKTIYDIGPIAYLLNKSKFTTKVISPDVLLKDGKVAYPKGRKVNYITAIPPHSYVWTDFLSSVNKVKGGAFKSKIFFVSDTHFGDESKVRKNLVPFGSVEEMNKEIIKRWNNKVGQNDVVYHMGDFGDYELVRQLNGKITLICGNHEKADYRKDFETFKRRLQKLGFADVIEEGMYLDESVLGEKVYLTHKPSKHVKGCKSIFGHAHTVSLVQEYGFNACASYHYFAPISVDTAKRYLKYIGNGTDEKTSN